MRNSKMLAKLRAGQPIKMGMMGHFLPSYIAHAAHYGFDAIWLDLEHRAMDAREVQTLQAYFHLYDIDCMVRPPTREKSMLYRYLEDGATGLMMPLVDSAATARDLVSKVRFPPLGDRGYEGRSLEANFGLDSAADRQTLVKHANQETLLALQIETPEGLANVDEIADVEGVDVIFIGPADLSIRLAYEPEANRLSMDQVIEKVVAACKKHNKAWGIMPANVDQVRDYTTRGAQMIPWQNDLALLQEGLARRSRELDEIIAQVWK